MSASHPELIPARDEVPSKAHFRIGEVARIVGVQPHVLRYWETEFSSIRPTKSAKGQRVYSRKDVQRLLQVKDLLRNQGFSIAGARKRLRELETPASWAPRGQTPSPPVTHSNAKALRRALVGLRCELHEWLQELRSAP